jgi:hypothetical protein
MRSRCQWINDIITSCPYSPLGRFARSGADVSNTSRFATDPVVADIALADGATPAQIALAWLLPLVPNVLISPVHLSAAIWQKTSGRCRGAATTNVRGEPGRLVQKPRPIINPQARTAIPWLALASLAGGIVHRAIAVVKRSPHSR